MRLPNEMKIRICNVMNKLNAHAEFCPECEQYIKSGDGDLCDKGKNIIALELAYTNTSLEFEAA